ncbi:MAG: glycerophosphoryl diester phosphodiesterase [Solirubrobacteraceae bacterium]|jgi:glycerophosphoryl diester phosphodiesterase|nr:glycerophosphoryl diester phosphodiesterase [Solirubrobacteraceae bacterium]
MSGLLRIGHKGADLIAPGNTLGSFDAALAHGVHMIEFDILPEHHDRPGEGRLLLAHDYEHVAGALELDAGLAHLASAPFADVRLDVDLKLPGYEERVIDALRTYGLIDRTLVSTMFMRSLVRLRELEPSLRLGWSVPRIKSGWAASPVVAVPGYGVLLYLRRRVVRAARAHLAAGRCDAVMAHYRLVTPALVKAVREEGGELYVWTVDDADHIRRLERLGVTGVITNDPRLFL